MDMNIVHEDSSMTQHEFATPSETDSVSEHLHGTLQVSHHFNDIRQSEINLSKPISQSMDMNIVHEDSSMTQHEFTILSETGVSEHLHGTLQVSHHCNNLR
jgi:hypothetical protein